MGDSATRGGFTFTDGTDAKPQAANSFTSGPNSSDVAFINFASRCGTTLITNSRVASILRTVSLRRPSRVLVGQNSTVGGFGQTPLKKLNGARLGWPTRLTVDTHAIGRGVIEAIMWR